MSEIDKKRYKAVELLEGAGWKFIENKWQSSPNLMIESPPNILSRKYEIAFKEIHSFVNILQPSGTTKYVWRKLEEIVLREGLW